MIAKRSMRPLVLAALTLMGVMQAAPVGAEEGMYWSVRSTHAYQVHVAFYSEWRNAEWPGSGQAYLLDAREIRNFNISCNRGEKVCLGAWVEGDTTRYWGVGSGRQHGCPSCCFHCGDGPVPTQVLNEWKR